MPAQTTDGVESASLFFVKRGGVGDSAAGYQYWLPSTIRAVTLDGRELWSYTTPRPASLPGHAQCSYCGEPVTHVAADNRGGVVLVTGWPSNLDDHTVRRLDGATGAVSWEYTSHGQMSEAAIHPDGTVFVVENFDDDFDYGINLVALDGDTGAVRARLRLVSSPYSGVGNFTSPLIREDGSVTVGTFSYDTDTFTLFDVPDGTLSPNSQTISYPEKDGDGLLMAGPVLRQARLRLIPDGQGGLLLSTPGIHRVYRIANGTISGPADVDAADPYWWGTTNVDIVIAEDGAYALTTRMPDAAPGTDLVPVQRLVKFDPVTLGVIGYGTVFDAPDATLRFATVGGGVFYSGPHYYGNGQQVGAGLFASWAGEGAPMLQLADIDVLMSEWSYSHGNEEGANAPHASVNVAVQFLPIDWAHVDSGFQMSPDEVKVIKTTAFEAMKAAFNGFAVTFTDGAGNPNDTLQRLVDVWPLIGDGGVGSTNGLGRKSNVYFWTAVNNLKEVVGCKTQTFSECNAKPREDLIKALGRGIGATVAHELGEQAGFHFTFDVSEEYCVNCYDCMNGKTYAHFFEPLHWSDNALQRMKYVLPRAGRAP